MFTTRAFLRSMFVVLCGAALLSSGCGGKSIPETAMDAATVAGPLLGPLMSAVPGLTEAQAILGAGSVLGLADAKMPDAQFDQVEKAVPGVDALIEEAKKAGLPSPLNSLADVTSFLNSKGIPPDQVAKLVPALGEVVKGKVPADVANAFVAALQ